MSQQRAEQAQVEIENSASLVVMSADTEKPTSDSASPTGADRRLAYPALAEADTFLSVTLSWVFAFSRIRPPIEQFRFPFFPPNDLIYISKGI